MLLAESSLIDSRSLFRIPHSPLFSDVTEGIMELRQTDSRNNGSAAIMAVAAALMAIGVVMVASASMSPTAPLFSDAIWSTTIGRQIIFVLAGGVLLFVLPRLARPLLASPVWRFRLAITLFALVLLMLLAAYVPGLADPRRGSNRWLSLAHFGLNVGFQPSEFAKPAMVLFLASYLTRFDPRSLWRGLTPAALAIGLCVVLVGRADFGTCALLAGVGGAMLLAAGCRVRYLLAIALIGCIGLAGLIVVEPYRLERITAHQNIWQDAQGGAYQPFQSLAAIASGGWFGRGLGTGIQKYGYLPEDHTDFIFAVICEETGMVGALLVVALFVMLIAVGLRTLRAARTPFMRLLAFGITVSIGLQALLNLAVVTVITPTTGISLPLISAGGSGLLATCVGLGLLSAAAQDTVQTVAPTRDPDTLEGDVLPARFVLLRETVR
jgi:cell division protein FtsW